MRSYPSPGDGFARLLSTALQEIKRIKTRVTILTKRLAALEQRVSDLEEE